MTTELYEIDLTEKELKALRNSAMVYTRQRISMLKALQGVAGPDDPDVVAGKALLKDIALLYDRVGPHNAYGRHEIAIMQGWAHAMIMVGAQSVEDELLATLVYVDGHALLDKMKKPLGGEDIAAQQFRDVIERQLKEMGG